jgi:DNA-binding LacI/PurR family transcriptional regulator
MPETCRSHRFQNLLADLRRQIRNSFSPGETLPAKREWALSHSVSPSTIQRAMQALAAEGAVRIEPSVGWVRTPQIRTASKAKTRCLKVGLLTMRVRDEWNDYELYPMLLEEARRRRIEIIEVPHRFEGARRSTPGRHRIELSRVPWNTFDAALLVEAENTIPAASAMLRNKPVIAVDMDATMHGFDSVSFMNAEAGAIAARYLMGLGHERFVIVEEGNVPGFAWDEAWTQRRHGFEAAAGAAGCVMRPGWRLAVPRQGPSTAGKEFFANEFPAIIQRWLDESCDRRPTAMMATAGSVISPVMTALARHDLRVPRDFSIVTFSSNRHFWFGMEPIIDDMRMTCVDLDLSAMVRRSFDAVDDLLKDGPPRRRTPRLYQAPATMLAGDSACEAPGHR